MLNAREMAALLEQQFAAITQRDLIEALRPLLVTPRCEHRDWDYGTEGQTYPCWIVAEHPDSGTALAYCEEGFGPSYPWGLLFLSGEYMSMGMDSQWFVSLEQCFRGSRAWEGENPPGYAAN